MLTSHLAERKAHKQSSQVSRYIDQPRFRQKLGSRRCLKAESFEASLFVADPTKSVACVRDWRDFSLGHYRLNNEGRKWRALAEKRRQLAEWLATFANKDGSSIFVGIERMEDKFECSRATIFRLLDDLRELHALAPKSGLTSRLGTAVRSLTLEAFEKRYLDEMEKEFASFEESQIQVQGVSGSQ